jgi:hypothetical protein
MKQLFILVLSLFLTVSFLNAKKKTPDKQLLQKLLQEVKQSKGDARRKAMNALKLKLRTVNAATRAKTMQELHHTFAGAHGQHGSVKHGMQQIPHQQMQQNMNQQHQMNTPHQSRPGQQMPNRQPGMPQRPPSGGHP